jgi:hypothetical protein
VVASGLGALYVATRNTSLLDQAEVSLDATISSLTYNGILRESCDLAASDGTTCDHDQVGILFLQAFIPMLHYFPTANFQGWILVVKIYLVH